MTSQRERHKRQPYLSLRIIFRMEDEVTPRSAVAIYRMGTDQVWMCSDHGDCLRNDRRNISIPNERSNAPFVSRHVKYPSSWSMAS